MGFGSIRRDVSWFLRLEGNLNAEVDDSVAKIKALGLSAADTKKAIKDLQEQQAAAAEVANVQKQNLLGMAAALGTVVYGIETAIRAFDNWVDSAVKADERLEKLHISTGEAGDSIHRYSQGVDALTTSFDQLLVKLSGPGFDRLTKVVDLLDRIASYANSGGPSGVISTTTAANVATLGGYSLGMAANSAITSGANKLMDWIGGYDQTTPVGQINAPTYGPLATDDQMTALYANDIYGPTPQQLSGVLAARSKKNLAWKGYQALVTKLPGVAYNSDPMFADYLAGTLPPGAFADLSGSSVSAPLIDSGTMAAMQTAAATLGTPARTPHPVTAQGFANVLGGFGGGLASGLAALGPAGVAVGAVAGLAPNLGKTADSLFSQIDHLAPQLMRGLDHIIDRLPDLITKVIPDLILGLAQLIPNLVTELVIKLPPALAKAIKEALYGGNDSSQKAQQRALAFAGNPGGVMGGGPVNLSAAMQRGRGGDVHFHTHGSAMDQVKAINKVLGSYGYGAVLAPPVTH